MTDLPLEVMDKFVIGLTGNIGTGKSAIMKVAAGQGAETIDADKVVHHILATNDPAKEQIKSTFGPEMLDDDGNINRAALGAIVFADPVMLSKLEGILHPIVRSSIIETVNKSTASLVMIEAIKLLEGPLKELCNRIWVADCGKLLQFQRLVIARGMDENEAFKRLATQADQAPQEAKLAQADLVIDTRGTLTQTEDQVLVALEKIREEMPSEPKTAWPTSAEAVPAAQALAAAPDTPAPAGGTGPLESAEPDLSGGIGLNVTVRRARPSDIASIVLLIHKATDGKLQPKRAEILESLSERGYLIGQIEADVSTVAGWYTDKGFSVIEQLYIHPSDAAEETGKAVLSEIRTTANNLLAEAIFAFVNSETPDFVLELYRASGYLMESPTKWPLVWQQTLSELQPPDTEVLVHKLRTMRVK